MIAPLRKRTFFSLAEINRAILEQLNLLNNKVMLAVGRSRRQEFEDIDQPNLRPIPEKPYEYAARKTARVHIDYHVEFEKHYYSVPYILVHQEVDIHVTEHMVEVFHKGKSIAIHPRSFKHGGFSTLHEHMPPNHQFMDQVNAKQLLHWAETVGPQTAAFINATLKSRSFPEQAYRCCLGILSLAKKYPNPQIELACQAALEAKTFSYKTVKGELDWLTKQPALPVTPVTLPAHANIRGEKYYQ
ncbi:MAG: Integrase catalytic region [Chloroflexi bacterium]|nr:MAG: Integrase catalytic region [Chloroflexota bacterium]